MSTACGYITASLVSTPLSPSRFLFRVYRYTRGHLPSGCFGRVDGLVYPRIRPHSPDSGGLQRYVYPVYSHHVRSLHAEPPPRTFPCTMYHLPRGLQRIVVARRQTLKINAAFPCSRRGALRLRASRCHRLEFTVKTWSPRKAAQFREGDKAPRDGITRINPVSISTSFAELRPAVFRDGCESALISSSSPGSDRNRDDNEPLAEIPKRRIAPR